MCNHICFYTRGVVESTFGHTENVQSYFFARLASDIARAFARSLDKVWRVAPRKLNKGKHIIIEREIIQSLVHNATCQSEHNWLTFIHNISLASHGCDSQTSVQLKVECQSLEQLNNGKQKALNDIVVSGES